MSTRFLGSATLALVSLVACGEVDDARSPSADESAERADAERNIGELSVDCPAAGGELQYFGGVPRRSPTERASGISPAARVDYLAIRYDTHTQSGFGRVTVDQSGVACATAKDPTTCAAALDDLGAEGDDCVAKGCGYYVVYTRGDTVGVLATKEEAAQFLAPIETPEEAYVLALFDGHEPRCLRPPLAASNVTDRYIDVLVFDSGCNVDERKVVFRAHRDGGTEIVLEERAGSVGLCASTQ